MCPKLMKNGWVYSAILPKMPLTTKFLLQYINIITNIPFPCINSHVNQRLGIQNGCKEISSSTTKLKARHSNLAIKIIC